MGVYAEHVLPRIIDKACGIKTSAPYREQVCSRLAGDVVEIGFGTGHNVPYYPAAVTGVSAVEPSDLCWRLADERLRASSVPVSRAGLDGARLPLDDARFDSALSTWTMCTIPDIRAALLELRRVMRPGATLHFIEHGLAPDAGVRRWQRRLEPVNKLVFGGCHLTRPIADLVSDAGFVLDDIETFYEPGAPKFAGAAYVGVAVNA